MPYATRADVELQYGAENVRKWADLDNLDDDDAIADRITWALGEADLEVNDMLRDGPYVIPFVTDSSSTIPGRIVSLAAAWAGVALYDGRSIADSDPKTDEVAGARKRFETGIRRILAGQYHLDYDYASAPYPQSVTERELQTRRAALGVPEPDDVSADRYPEDPWKF